MSSETEEIKNNSFKTQSDAVQTLLLSAISSEFNLVKEDLKIMKSEFGIPSVYDKSQKLDLAVSLTHHGNYRAYAYLNSVSTTLELAGS